MFLTTEDKVSHERQALRPGHVIVLIPPLTDNTQRPRPLQLPKPKSSFLDKVKDKITTFDEPDMVNDWLRHGKLSEFLLRTCGNS